jgi:hypothetical protein
MGNAQREGGKGSSEGAARREGRAAETRVAAGARKGNRRKKGLGWQKQGRGRRKERVRLEGEKRLREGAVCTVVA